MREPGQAPPITEVELLVAIVLAAVLYVLFLVLMPEPRAVYGPDGPRIGRTTSAEPPAVVARAT